MQLLRGAPRRLTATPGGPLPPPGCAALAESLSVTKPETDTMPGALLLLLTVTAGALASAPNAPPPTILYDGAALAAQKTALPHDASVQRAVAALEKVAAAQLNTGPFSVINKTILPASGDVHDYFSTASYFWPCSANCTAAISAKLGVPCVGKQTGWCDQHNLNCNWTAATDPSEPPAYPCNHSSGTPWVSHTGYSNSAFPGLVSDRNQIDGVWHSIMPLILYSWYSDSVPHRQRAVTILRTFFLDPATRMNPALDFAQSIPGSFDGVAGGLVDFARISWLVDALILLEDSDPTQAVWTAEDRTHMNAWVTSFLQWFTTSPMGRSGLLLHSNIADSITIGDMVNHRQAVRCCVHGLSLLCDNDCN